MIRFKEPSMQRDWPTVHPELRVLLVAFDEYSVKWDLPEPVVTDLVRSPEQQMRVYVRFWKKLQAALADGPHHNQIDPEDDGTFRPLTPVEYGQAVVLRPLTDEQLAARARQKFTWHWVRCAMDLRSREYSPDELSRVRKWFQPRCQAPLWEFLVHDVTAPHIHCARRDFAWRARWLPESSGKPNP